MNETRTKAATFLERARRRFEYVVSHNGYYRERYLELIATLGPDAMPQLDAMYDNAGRWTVWNDGKTTRYFFERETDAVEFKLRYG